MKKKCLCCLPAFILFCYGLNACRGNDFEIVGNEIRDDTTTVYIAVLGDIQFYTNPNHIDLYKHTLDWLRNKSEEGWYFNCILHTGDITMDNEVFQWECFYQATRDVAHLIPFYSMIGDHDYTWEDGIHINNRHSTLFNSYTHFPLSENGIIDRFEEGKMENVVVENVIFGHRLNLLILEFGPRKEVVEWANAYVKAHPSDCFILMTHEYLEKGGERRTDGLKCAARLRNTTYTTPEELWHSLIKCNDNIRVVLCGHVASIYALTVEKNDFGREIPQIQHNIQGSNYRYDNWLMLWEFSHDSDTVNVCIYNTKTDCYYNDQTVLFQFNYRDSLKTN